MTKREITINLKPDLLELETLLHHAAISAIKGDSLEAMRWIEDALAKIKRMKDLLK